ncbi:MAG TPA: type II toxin-antitoxin system PemK/MazF family toxin [Bacillota bacterium]|nr:type II toxin-antitoxin system PemK/MazF family toxin [Bacillota bacterium]
MPYIPKQGDIVWITLDPQTGHEQKGRRPALILSNDSFIRLTGLALACPITRTDNHFPLHLELSGYKTSGFTMLEHIKSLDYEARQIEYIESLEEKDLIEALSRVNACL